MTTKVNIGNAQDVIVRAYDTLAFLSSNAPHESLSPHADHGRQLVLHLAMDNLTLARDHLEDAMGGES